MKNRKEYKASLTVEAALAFPVFFFAVMALCCLFLYMEAETAVGEAMLETARSVSVYGDILKEPPVELILEEKLKDHPIAVNTIVGGISGISCGGSDICTDDGCMRLVCSYEFRSPVPGLGLPGIKGSSELVYRYFTGTAAESLLEEKEQEAEKEEEETVYKTETGTVYHVSLTCPSLKLHILMTEAGEVGGKRNEYGAKYYPCEKCVSGAAPETIYITTDGDRYHYKLDCSGLKRTIIEIKKSEIGSLRPCKRCGEKGD